MQMKRYPTIDLEATGRQIARLRQERGLTVRDMQNYFGFDAPQAIYKWQKGLTLPSVDNLYALSVLLEVPMNAILVQVNHPRCDERQDSSCRPVFLPGIRLKRCGAAGESAALLPPWFQLRVQ